MPSKDATTAVWSGGRRRELWNSADHNCTTEFPATDQIPRLWRHLFGGDSGYLSLFSAGHVHGTKTQDAHSERAIVRAYPSSAEAAAGWLRDESDRGRDAYFTVHLLCTKPERGKRGTKEDSGHVRALWSDLDHVPVPTGALAPTAVTESSPSRYQAFWRLTRALDPYEAERLNERLNRALGVPGGWQLTKLLRAPDTTNFTQPGLPTVRLIHLDEDRAIGLDELGRILPNLSGSSGESDRDTFNEPGWAAEWLRTPLSVGSRREPTVGVPKYLGRLRYLGLELEEAVEIVRMWNERNPEPLPESEVHKTARSIWSRYKPGSKLLLSDDHHDHYPRGNDGDDDPIDLGTLTDPGPVRFTVEDFMPEGFTTNLYADSGQGKSYVAIHLGLCALNGEPFLGKTVTPGPVLLLDWELDAKMQRRRWGEVCRGAGCDIPQGLHYKRMHQSLPDALDEIRMWQAAIKPVVTIVDSVGKAMGSDPLDARSTIAFYNALDLLGTTLAIDHQPKPGGDGNYANKWEFGSSYKRHLSRASWQLERVGADAGRVGLVLRQKKNNFGPILPEIHALLAFSDDAEGRLCVTLEAAAGLQNVQGKTFGLRGAILDCLRDEPMTAAELAEAIDEHEIGPIRNALTALKQAGLVVETGKRERATLYARPSIITVTSPTGDDHDDRRGRAARNRQPSSANGDQSAIEVVRTWLEAGALDDLPVIELGPAETIFDVRRFAERNLIDACFGGYVGEQARGRISRFATAVAPLLSAVS